MRNRNLAVTYLKDFLKIAPLSHALWRSTEALAFSRIKFQKPVLDIGCGFGEFAGVVFNQLEMGVDINNKDLKKAFKGCSYAKLQWADIRCLPFKDNSYSTVVSVSVMEHIAGCGKVIQEVKRVLKKGGIFAFSVPTTDLYSNLLVPKIFKFIYLEFLGKMYFKLHCRIFKHINLRHKNWWIKQLQINGFQMIKAHGTVSPMVLKLHELFLIFSLPSQVWKILFGKRLIISLGLRSKILPLLFSRFIYLDKISDLNTFFVAKKL